MTQNVFVVSRDECWLHMDAESYIDYWGATKLMRWTPEALRDVQIPEASKTFLKHVGMPTPGRDVGPYNLSWDQALPILGTGRRVLGRNYSEPYLLDEENGGCVLVASVPALPGSGREMDPERWLNSSVEQFAAFLTEYDKLRNRISPYDWKPNYGNSVDIFGTRIKEIDPTALSDPNGYWACVMFEERLDYEIDY